MKQLDKITISNVRRFSENVQIPIGKGATVFLAPNGTGKTAIFEAIELALTGSVKRLPFPPDALIRDSQSKSSIRLDFDSGKFCEASFVKGEDPILTGNHEELFGSIPKGDVPFLLRLTHMLNQRGSDWLVQSQSSDAAGQLDHLSIGRDALHVNNLMTSAKRAATSVMDSNSQKFDELKERLDNWLNLLNKRISNTSDLQKSLIQLPEILNQLNRIGDAQRILPINSQELAALKGYHGVINAHLEREKEIIFKSIVDLEALHIIIRDFSETNQLLVIANEDLNKSREAKREVAKEITDLQEKFLTNTKEIQLQEELLIRYNTIKERLEQLDKISRDIENIEIVKRNYTESVSKLQLEISSLSSRHEAAKKASEFDKEFRNRSILLAEERSKIFENSKLLDEWKANNVRLEELLKQQPDLQQQLENAKTILQEKLNARDAAKYSFEQVQNAYAALNSSADLIKDAIGSIAGHLPANLNECPLCLHEYKDGELHQRVQRALANINPILQQTAESLEKEKEKSILANLDYTETLNVFDSISKQDDDNKSEIIQINQIINGKLTYRLYNALTIDDAITQHEIELKTLADSEEAFVIENDKHKLEKPLEPLAPLQEKLDELNSELLDFLNRISDIEKELINKNNSKSLIDQSVQSEEKFEDIFAKISTQELLVDKLKADLESIRLSQENKQRILGQINDILSKDEDNYNQITLKLNEGRSRWSNGGLLGEPSNTILNSRKELLENSLLTINTYLIEINSISDELVKWQTFEEHFNIEKEIKEMRGDLSEREFEEKLRRSTENANNRILFYNKKNTTLNVLSRNLIEQLENINKQITSINPLWKKLLKRIVLDPRFASTTLNSYTHYRKQHADVNVQLHGKEYIAAQIASEAQITDLQFTFLLAMAQKYQWSG